MKKKIILILALPILLLSIACTAPSNDTPRGQGSLFSWTIGGVSSELYTGNSGIYITIPQGGVTRFGAYIIVNNNIDLYTEDGYVLQVWYRGNWYEIVFEHPSISLGISFRVEREFREIWADRYGALPNGRYRYVMEVYHQFVEWTGTVITSEPFFLVYEFEITADMLP